MRSLLKKLIQEITKIGILLSTTVGMLIAIGMLLSLFGVIDYTFKNALILLAVFGEVFLFFVSIFTLFYIAVFLGKKINIMDDEKRKS